MSPPSPTSTPTRNSSHPSSPSPSISLLSGTTITTPKKGSQQSTLINLYLHLFPPTDPISPPETMELPEGLNDRDPPSTLSLSLPSLAPPPVVHSLDCDSDSLKGKLYITAKGVGFYANMFGINRKWEAHYLSGLGYDSPSPSSPSGRSSPSGSSPSGSSPSHPIYRILSFALTSSDSITLTLYAPNSSPQTTTKSLKVKQPAVYGIWDLLINHAVKAIIRNTHGLGELHSEGGSSTEVRDSINKGGSAAANIAKSIEEGEEAPEPKGMRSRGTSEGEIAVDSSPELFECGPTTISPVRDLKWNLWGPAGLPLSMTLDDFISTFLSNDATEGVGKYHSEECSDEVHMVSPWIRVPGSPSGHYSRAIDFTTKVVGSPIGPDKTKATKTQTLEWGTNGFVMTTVTDLKDIPSADAFVVRDVVSILKDGEEGEGIRVHCSYQVDFLKSSFWKSIIESKTKNETKTWVTKYYKWAEGLKGKGKGRSLSASNAAAEEPEDRQTHKTEPTKYLVIGMCASQALLFLFVIYLIVKQNKTNAMIHDLQLSLTSLEAAMDTCSPPP
ncbi:hypothetical protein TrCOL_g9400 [Triparma columacea]|uniref:VASt domain-containing protein n=1 Tax=Triparma columacea TaxID=722753 RepID=A0A9W7GP73_9STRA|nr:hypothetical protein TrCOL_g9400 [Triparma columacea]